MNTKLLRILRSHSWFIFFRLRDKKRILHSLYMIIEHGPPDFFDHNFIRQAIKEALGVLTTIELGEKELKGKNKLLFLVYKLTTKEKRLPA